MRLDEFDIEVNHANFSNIWNECTSEIFRVVDEDGNNVAAAECRHFLGPYWLYVDNAAGFSILSISEIDDLLLEKLR